MISTVNSLKDLYVKMGGSLTDTYEGIANGVPVADYNVIPDMIEAITQKADSGGGGGDSVLIVEVNVDPSDNKNVLGKTWKEIKDAFCTHGAIVHEVFVGDVRQDDWYPINWIQESDGGGTNVYFLQYGAGYSQKTFVTDNENGYPKSDS